MDLQKATKSAVLFVVDLNQIFVAITYLFRVKQSRVFHLSCLIDYP